MNILMVVAYGVPEIGSAAHLYMDLAKAFVDDGHYVEMITSYPRDFNLEDGDSGRDFPLREIVDGVTINRVRHFAARDNPLLRGVEHFTLPLFYFERYRELATDFDVCLIYIPPLPLYYFARKLKEYDGTPSILNFQDFHPQELTDVGMLKNRLAIRLLESIERKAYENADQIVVLSRGGIRYVVERGADPRRADHIYNGVPLASLHGGVTTGFKRREGIGDRFLVTYAGILSPFQGVGYLLDVAKDLREEEDLIFYIVGDGMARNDLIKRVAKEELDNVRILPWQPREKYFEIINSSDLSIVSLDSRMKAPCLPGKIRDLMALGRPIVGIVPSESEAARLIGDARCGVVVDPRDGKALPRVILDLKKDPKIRKKMGVGGRLFVNGNMQLDAVTKTYEKIIRSFGESEYNQVPCQPSGSAGYA